jgi:hypothetical protein
MESRLRRSSLLIAVLAGLPFLVACDEDPADAGDHLPVHGVALFEGTAEIYRYSAGDGPAPGLALDTGVTEVTVIPLDAEGEAVREDLELAPELAVDILDPSVLAWTTEPSRGAHDFVEFFGEFEGLEAGATSLGLCVGHDSHCDFEVELPVAVGPQ